MSVMNDVRGTFGSTVCVVMLCVSFVDYNEWFVFGVIPAHCHV